MDYQAKNYEQLLGLAGFSDQLLNNHFTLYKGYVTNTNKITESLWALAKEEKTAAPEYAELKRRGGWEWNGMRLHELYFENLTKGATSLPTDSNLYQNIAKFFDSFENWEKLFKATGAMRGIGWVVLYHDKDSGNFFNAWINEHDVGHLTGAAPLLVMDVFEHAYMLDYQLKKADYIEAFFKAINWNSVEARM
jgi:Fe-Mn family superoxide dismutase